MFCLFIYHTIAINFPRSSSPILTNYPKEYCLAKVFLPKKTLKSSNYFKPQRILWTSPSLEIWSTPLPPPTLGPYCCHLHKVFDNFSTYFWQPFHGFLVDWSRTVVRGRGEGGFPHESDGGDRRKFWKEPLRGTRVLFSGHGSHKFLPLRVPTQNNTINMS